MGTHLTTFSNLLLVMKKRERPDFSNMSNNVTIRDAPEIQPFLYLVVSGRRTVTTENSKISGQIE
jgi:hypothetical protein